VCVCVIPYEDLKSCSSMYACKAVSSGEKKGSISYKNTEVGDLQKLMS
jgi:hypothetical protein